MAKTDETHKPFKSKNYQNLALISEVKATWQVYASLQKLDIAPKQHYFDFQTDQMINKYVISGAWIFPRNLIANQTIVNYI